MLYSIQPYGLEIIASGDSQGIHNYYHNFFDVIDFLSKTILTIPSRKTSMIVSNYQIRF